MNRRRFFQATIGALAAAAIAPTTLTAVGPDLTHGGSLTAITSLRVSDELLRDSAVDVEQWVAEHLTPWTLQCYCGTE